MKLPNWLNRLLGRENVAKLRAELVALRHENFLLKERNRFPTEADLQASKWRSYLEAAALKAPHSILVAVRAKWAFDSRDESKELDSLWPWINDIQGMEFASLLIGVRRLYLYQQAAKRQSLIQSTAEAMQDRMWHKQDVEDFGAIDASS